MNQSGLYKSMVWSCIVCFVYSMCLEGMKGRIVGWYLFMARSLQNWQLCRLPRVYRPTVVLVPSPFSSLSSALFCSSHSTSHIYLANFRIWVSLKLRTFLPQRSTYQLTATSYQPTRPTLDTTRSPLPASIVFISRILRTMHIGWEREFSIRDFALGYTLIFKLWCSLRLGIWLLYTCVDE